MAGMATKRSLPRGLCRVELQDGYEQGGLVYFRMNGKEMVLIVRERRDFDKMREGGKTLQEYCSSRVSPVAYDAAKAIEMLIREVPD
jgi:hypothetical protein